MYMRQRMINVENSDRPSVLALRLEAQMGRIERERDFLFERVISGLNTRLNNRLSLLKGEEVFLIEEDRDRWLLFATEDERKEISEFINEVFNGKARFSIGSRPFEKLFRKWYVHFHSNDFSELDIVIFPASKTGMEIAEIAEEYFGEMGFKVKPAVMEDE